MLETGQYFVKFNQRFEYRTCVNRSATEVPTGIWVQFVIRMGTVYAPKYILLNVMEGWNAVHASVDVPLKFLRYILVQRFFFKPYICKWGNVQSWNYLSAYCYQEGLWSDWRPFPTPEEIKYNHEIKIWEYLLQVRLFLPKRINGFDDGVQR